MTLSRNVAVVLAICAITTLIYGAMGHLEKTIYFDSKYDIRLNRRGINFAIANGNVIFGYLTVPPGV